jgi:hypothetical protein
VNHTETITRIDLKITVKDTSNPIYIVNFDNTPTETGGMFYNSYITNLKIDYWQGVFSVIINENSHSAKKPIETKKQPPATLAGELKELKSLLDEGIITNEEFIQQKNKILNRS